MRVMVDVFSGRENPSWEITPEEQQRFVNQLHSLAELGHEPKKVELLGYRGIMVLGQPDKTGGFEEISISFGFVQARIGTDFRYFVDSGRELERLLLQTAQGRIDDSIYNTIVEQFERTSPDV